MLIAISGKHGSGKTTLAKAFKDTYNFKVLSFEEFQNMTGEVSNIVVDGIDSMVEYDYLRNEGFVMIRLNCDEHIRKERKGEDWDVEQEGKDVLRTINNPFQSDVLKDTERFWDVSIMNNSVEKDRFVKTVDKIYKAFSELEDN